MSNFHPEWESEITAGLPRYSRRTAKGAQLRVWKVGLEWSWELRSARGATVRSGTGFSTSQGARRAADRNVKEETAA